MIIFSRSEKKNNTVLLATTNRHGVSRGKGNETRCAFIYSNDLVTDVVVVCNYNITTIKIGRGSAADVSNTIKYNYLVRVRRTRQ